MWSDLPEGATPLDPGEAEDLIPPFIYTKEALNRWEQENILEAERWLFSPRTRRRIEMTRESRMVGVELRNLCDDATFWIERGTYDLDGTAARIHHRLVAIHPFPNGNGRHARIVADAVLFRAGHPRFTWGSANLVEAGEVRRRYIAALRAADGHDYRPLLQFVRS